jgi:DNA-binding GntR family transcriptional regulator
MSAEPWTRDDPNAVFAWSPSPGSPALSLPEQVAEIVGNAIIRGRLQPGDRVHEQELADRFVVSRGPVREALRILERDGLVQIQARRGARVTELAIDEVDEVFELRGALLSVAARRIALRGDREVTAAIRSRVDALRSLARGDADDYVRAAHELNLMIADASNSRLLRSMFFSLAHRTLRYTRLGLATETRRMQSARKWKQLWVAIDARDAAAAGQLAEALVRDSRDMAVAILRGPTTTGKASHEEGPDRQSGRDRLPDHPQLPRARAAGGRRLLRA